jgi:hypothetical protein
LKFFIAKNSLSIVARQKGIEEIGTFPGNKKGNECQICQWILIDYILAHTFMHVYLIVKSDSIRVIPN